MLYPIENRVREVKNLSGIWNFKIDKNNSGISERWFEAPLKDAVLMAVPSSYNDLVTDASEREHVGYVWYETGFIIPAGWEGRRIVIRFGSAAHHAVCWINGQEILRHKGGFLPFEAEDYRNCGSIRRKRIPPYSCLEQCPGLDLPSQRRSRDKRRKGISGRVSLPGYFF